MPRLRTCLFSILFHLDGNQKQCSAIAVSLYPTNIRAMATCFIFMFGRIGGLAGGNLIGALLENHCNTIFNIFGVLSIGKIGVKLVIFILEFLSSFDQFSYFHSLRICIPAHKKRHRQISRTWHFK